MPCMASHFPPPENCRGGAAATASEPFEESSRLLYVVFTRARKRVIALLFGTGFCRVAGNQDADAGRGDVTAGRSRQAAGMPGFPDSLLAALQGGSLRSLMVRWPVIAGPGGSGNLRGQGIGAIADPGGLFRDPGPALQVRRHPACPGHWARCEGRPHARDYRIAFSRWHSCDRW